MNLTFFDTDAISERTLDGSLRALGTYRERMRAFGDTPDLSVAESALVTWADQEGIERVKAIAKTIGRPKHVVLVGIGGSSLGTEAIHSVLAHKASPELHVLDTVSASELSDLLLRLHAVKRVSHVAVVVVSKSGATTETLANAGALLAALEIQFGAAIYEQTVFIGDPGSPLLSTGKKLKAHTIAMLPSVGGRYSVFTTVGLVPLAILGHDFEMLLHGLREVFSEPYEEATAESAARLFVYLKKGIRHVNFFAFNTRLVRLGKWYRQLAAESLGKAEDRAGRPVKLGFVPTISTAVELHSVGQLYFSRFPGVYTDFVSLPPQHPEYIVPKQTKIAPQLKGKSLDSIQEAMYQGVIDAYQATELPYRSIVLDGDATQELGIFMGMRMLETMYVAELMNVDAFTQPNVELYKERTRHYMNI